MIARPLLLVLFGLLLSAPAYGEDLMQVYRDALTNDPQYTAAKALLNAGLEKLPQGRAGLLPTLGLNASTLWNDNDTRTGSQPENHARFNTNGYNLTLMQPLYRWQNIVAYDQAKLYVAQAEAQYLLAQQELILRVAEAYFAILLAEENLAALRAQKTAIGEQLAQAKKNFAVGIATITDTHEAQSRFDLVSAQEIAAENDLEVSRQALQAIIGREPRALAYPRPDAHLSPPEPAQMDAWVQQAEEDAVSVLIQQTIAEIAAREISIQRAGHYPTLDIVANIGRNRGMSPSLDGGGAPIGERNETHYSNIGLQLNLPLFQGGAISSKTREAAANRDAALAALDKARRDAALAAKQSYLGVVNGLAQILALNAAQVSSKSALDANKRGYQVGIRINLDVLDAEQQVSLVRRDLAKARFNTMISQLRLKAAVGSLSERDLEEVNTLLIQSE